MKKRVDLARQLLENAHVQSLAPTPVRAPDVLTSAALLGLVHFLVDAVCVTAVLRTAAATDLRAAALVVVLSYDLLAFAGQAPLGWLVDRLDLRRASTLAGVALTASTVLVVGHSFSAVVILAGLGNALFHLGAGATVLSASGTTAAPAGVFVGPGALGLGLGLLLGRRFVTVPLWPSLFALVGALALVALVRASRTPAPAPMAAADRGRSSSMVTLVTLAVLLCLSVAVRSLVGTVACDGCNKTLFLAIALPVAGCGGKMIGGFLADRFGWIDLSMIALLASAPLLAFSGGDLWLALPGSLLFQMTMPVTLAAMFRLMPTRPALAFGLPCLALILGALPAYLPGVWRPHGIAVLALGLGSAAALLIALRGLGPSRQAPQVPSMLVQAPSSPGLCKDNP